MHVHPGGIRRWRRHVRPRGGAHGGARPDRTPPGARACTTASSRTTCSYGTEEQKQHWLPKMATGEVVGAIAMTEPGTGSDLQTSRPRRSATATTTSSTDPRHSSPTAPGGPDRRGRQDRPDEGAAGISLILVEAGPRGLPSRPRARQDRPEGSGHLRAVLRRRAASRVEPARDRQRGRASSS